VSATIAPIVVIGVGNALVGDDAVGLRMLDVMERRAAADPSVFPPRIRFVDGGTVGLDLLRVAEGARAILLLDAVDIGMTPGEVVVLAGDAITTAGARGPGGPTGGLGEVLALARLMDWFAGPVALVGVQVGEMAFSPRLTPDVEAALPVAVEVACQTLVELDADAPKAAPPDSALVMETTR